MLVFKGVAASKIQAGGFMVSMIQMSKRSENQGADSRDSLEEVRCDGETDTLDSLRLAMTARIVHKAQLFSFKVGDI